MGDNIIEDKFNAWTKGLDALKARISVFEHIRDIPYAIVAELRDPVSGPPGLLKLNQGSCVPKHFLLGLLFSKLGIPVKYASYRFSWNDDRIQYPPELRQLAKEMPITAHLACKAYINKKWILIDATYDPPLKRVGFTVNEIWDGVSDCRNAVIPIEEIIHDTLDDRVRYSTSQRKAYTEKEIVAYERFAAGLNAWLESIRG